ncbi:MAG: hypothetical protein ACKN9U_09835 [Pirellulaceae bacterium]
MAVPLVFARLALPPLLCVMLPVETSKESTDHRPPLQQEFLTDR